MINLGNNGFTAEEVRAVLHAKNQNRPLDFAVRLFDNDNRRDLGLFDDYVSETGTVTLDSEREVQRYFSFDVRDNGILPELSRIRLQPEFIVGMPRKGFNGLREARYSLGRYLVTTSPPTGTIGKPTMKVQAYDYMHILTRNKLLNGYKLEKGHPYRDYLIDLVVNQCGILDIDVDQSEAVVPAEKVYNPNTTVSSVVKEICTAMTFVQWFNLLGTFKAKKWIDPSTRSADYAYHTNDENVLKYGGQLAFEIYDVPNRVKLVASQVCRKDPLEWTEINNNPQSPTSHDRRGFYIDALYTDGVVADTLEALVEQTKRKLFTVSQVFMKLTLPSLPMPHHEFQDVLDIEYSPLEGGSQSVRGNYLELGFTLPMKPGSDMQHTISQVIPVNQLPDMMM